MCRLGRLSAGELSAYHSQVARILRAGGLE